MGLGLVEINVDSEMTVVFFGPAEANDEWGIITPEDDATFVEVAMVHAGLVNGE